MREATISIGIDIGSTKVITCVGKHEDGSCDIIGMGVSDNQGIRKGVIVDVEETVSAITSSIQEAERMSGFPVQQASIGISGPYIECEQSKGIIAISRPDGVICEEDILRVLEAAKAIPTKQNREVLHALPQNYIIDGTEVIKDPNGMTGIRLEVISNIISASSNAVKSLDRAFEQTGVQINSKVFSPLSLAKLLLNKRQMDIGVLLIDIGAATTSYVSFEEGEITTCGVVPVGSMHITNDIAIGLRTSLDIAEEIKIKYGYALPDKVDEKEVLSLSKFDKNEEGEVKIKYVSEIIEARINEIFCIIKENLAKNNCNDALPAGVVLTGGGAKIDGIVELAKETLRLPAKIGKPSLEIAGLIDKLEDPIYSTSIGLMLWDKDKSPEHGNFSFDFPGINGVVDKVKSIFKHILP